MNGKQDTLYFLTCGHVDDGKSTLIGRMLQDAGVVPEDQLKGVMVNGVPDYSRLTDGLEDERAQGITIDVAYRYFRFQGRHFRIADTPGHVQYFRNMASAALGNDCALIVIDAKHGVREQTIRYSRVVAFFGIRHFIIIVNKMDLVDYREEVFSDIVKTYQTSFADMDGIVPYFIPVSALHGKNIVSRSSHDMPWYQGKSLLDYLVTLERGSPEKKGVRLPVQSLIRFEELRGYQGMLTGGMCTIGDVLGIAGSDMQIHIARLYHSGREVKHVHSGQAITLIPEEDVDLSRGNVLFSLSEPIQYTDVFRARITWLQPACVQKEKIQAILKIHTREEQAEIHVKTPGKTVSQAEIFLARSVPIDCFTHNKQTGLFLLIEPEKEDVIGVGIVCEPEAKDWNFSI